MYEPPTPLTPPRMARDLIAAIQRGSEPALRELYRRESRRLFGIARRILGRDDLAAEALQEAFLQVWQNAASFTPERGDAAAWLTGIVRYRALDLRRRHAREMSAEPMPADRLTEPALEDSPEARLVESALRRCLEALEGNQRQSILLAYVEGLSHADIAVRSAAPLGTVKSWVRRGLLSLKACLGA